MTHPTTNNISSYKKNIKSLLENLDSLRTYYNMLENHNQNNPIPTSTLQLKENTKIQIEKTLIECENPQKIIEIKKKIRHRLKKRKILKEKQFKKQQIKKERFKLHEKIDKSLNIIKQNNIELLARKQATEHAKIILTEINQKKFEALKYIKLFKSLTELRLLRKQKERLPDPNGEIWIEKINQLLLLWEDTLEEYIKEESNLKSLLAYNSKSLEDQWREVIFGDMDCDKKLTKTSYLNDFFDIRRTWDSYIVPDHITGLGSSIPTGWVLPPANPSDKWMAFMFK